jgi:hypothetical protein
LSDAARFGIIPTPFRWFHIRVVGKASKGEHMSATVGRFSCGACGKTYAWKPELAGRRVKCKCGQPVSVPADDPATASIPEGFDDLMALADGASAEPSHAAAPGASGAQCPGCGAGVAEGSVICINCGHNLKTGKRLKTSKVTAGAAASAGAAAAERMPGYRSYGIKTAEDEAMTPEKKKLVAIICVFVLVGVVGAVAAIVIMDPAKGKERQARIDAQPAKLEKLIENMDNAGGIGAAMKDGSLLKGVNNPSKTQAQQMQELEERRSRMKLDQRAIDFLEEKMPEVKEWLAANPKAFINSHTHEESIALADQAYALGMTDIHLAGRPDTYQGNPLVGGIVGTLPTDEAKRKKVFAWYAGLPKTSEHPDFAHQSERGQKYLMIEFLFE